MLSKSLTVVFSLSTIMLFAQEKSQEQIKHKLTMSLEDVVETARDQSPSALVAKYNFLADYWQFRTYKAQFLPSLNLSASLGQYNRSLLPLQNSTTGEIDYIVNNNLKNSLSLSIDQNIALTGGTVSINTSMNRLDQFSPSDNTLFNSQPISLYYSQPIKAYNTLKWEKKIEPKKYESARRTYLESMEAINISVTSLFFEVLSAQIALDMAQKNYNSTSLSVKIAQERYEIGAISKSDLLQLKLRLLNDELAISDNRLKMDVSMLGLKTYLGFNESVEIELIMPQMTQDIKLNFDDVYAKAVDNSSFALENELLTLNAEKNVAQAKSNSGLKANFFARFGLTQKGDNFSSSYKNPIDQEVIGLGLELPILDWGLGKGKVKLAKSLQEVVKSQVDQAYTKHRQDILIKVLQFNKQSMQCSISSQADSVAKLRYDISRERFQNGTIGVLDLNTAQSEKDQAVQRYISDLNNYWQYYYTIRKLSLYDYVKGCSLSTDFDKIIDK